MLMGVVDSASNAAISVISPISSEFMLLFCSAGSFPSSYIVCTRPLLKFAAGIVERSPCFRTCMGKIPPSIHGISHPLRHPPIPLDVYCSFAILFQVSYPPKVTKGSAHRNPGDASLDLGLSEGLLRLRLIYTFSLVCIIAIETDPGNF